jgi:hypothetical protein
MCMKRRNILMGVLLYAATAAAQTVTGSGTMNTVPVFTGSSTIGNSPITLSGGNVGIGIASPLTTLDLQSSGNVEFQGILMRQPGLNNGIIPGPNTMPASNAYLELEPYDPNNGGLYVAGYSGSNYVPGIVLTGSVGTTAVDPSIAVVQVVGSKVTGSGNWAEIGNSENLFQITNNWNPVLTVQGSGSVGIGTTNPGAALEVNGNIKLTANSGSSMTFQDGTTQSTAYTGVTCGGDYAESVDVTGNRKRYEPGDVMVVDTSAPGKFLKASQPYSTLVAGIYSTRPGTTGRRQLTPKSPDEVPMAMMGIVPTKVTTENGPIRVGDLLVASSTPGHAMKGTDRNLLTGAVIGKALASLDSGSGVIEVLVTLQ